MPNELILNYWNKLLHEWIGYITYWLVGYI
jgi:hypothetical protein